MASSIPVLYTLFFLWIEPVATALGGYYAHFQPDMYMALTEQTSPTTILGSNSAAVSTREAIVLTQLANLYFVFALNEAFVLRAAGKNLAVWKVFLFGLLLADFGHLYSCRAFGAEMYWRFWDWNAIYWGNLGFVYVGASMRTAFLLGIGLPSSSSSTAKVKQ